MRILAIISVFIAGSIFGVGALRAWQQTKIFIANSRITMLDVRYEILQTITHQPSIVMLGDSITANLPWRDASDCVNVSNYGMDGDTTEGIMKRLREVILLKPKAVFLMIGANDILKQHNINETAENIRSIVDQLSNVDITVYVHPILPINGIENIVMKANIELTKMLENSNAIIVPLSIDVTDTRDGLHLATSGFMKWHETIKPLIRRHC